VALGLSILALHLAAACVAGAILWRIRLHDDPGIDGTDPHLVPTGIGPWPGWRWRRLPPSVYSPERRTRSSGRSPRRC
jgi:hypothetical protein